MFLKKNIVVFGAGPIGNLTAQVAKGLGAKSVIITDISDYRLEIAQKCGIDHSVNVSNSDLNKAIDAHFGKSRADAMLECVGTSSTIEQAIQLARKGSQIVIVGVFSEKPALDLGLVQDKELSLLGTLMYQKKDYLTAIDLIEKETIVLEPLITCYYSFKDYAKAYKYIENNREKSMKVIINMEQS